MADFYLTNGGARGADLFVVGPGAIDRAGAHAALLTALGNEDGPIVDCVGSLMSVGRGDERTRC